MKIKKNGKVVKKTKIDRLEIGEKTAQKLREAENIEDIKEYLARIHDIDLEKQGTDGDKEQG